MERKARGRVKGTLTLDLTKLEGRHTVINHCGVHNTPTHYYSYKRSNNKTRASEFMSNADLVINPRHSDNNNNNKKRSDVTRAVSKQRQLGTLP